MSKPKKLLVLTSGGDAPGMNAALRAVVRTALYYDIEVFGSRLGYRGILEGEIIPLEERSVANCIQRGGTILQSARYPEFSDKKIRSKAIAILKEYEIDSLVVLGGDGSFRGATLLNEEGGMQVIGIPCTIDNDIVGSDYSIGFDTARNTALEAIDRIRDTAFSHNRDFLVEVMGRSAGFLAVDVGIAGGAEFILIPEVPYNIEQLAEQISTRSRHKLGSIMVVAEAGKVGRSMKIAEELKQRINRDYKVCILGHTQRGGTPSLLDRKIASLMGTKAVQLLLGGQTNKMIAMKNDHFIAVDFPSPTEGSRQFNDMELLAINKLLCSVK